MYSPSALSYGDEYSLVLKQHKLPMAHPNTASTTHAVNFRARALFIIDMIGPDLFLVKRSHFNDFVITFQTLRNFVHFPIYMRQKFCSIFVVTCLVWRE